MIVWAKIAGILGAVLIVFFAGYHVGGMAPKLADAKAEVKQEVAADTKRTADQTTVAQEAQTYEDAQLAPIAAPVVRMCEYAPAARLPSPNPTGPGTHAPAATHGADPVPPVPGPDIGPGLLRSSTVAEAQVAGLQDYINRVCQAKAP